MTASWILPVVTFVVASSTGAVIAEPVREFSVHAAFVTVIVAAFILTLGLSLASMMLATYVLRLVVYGFPPGSSVFSIFLPLGVSAQASYSVSLIGAELQSLLPLLSSHSPFFSLRVSGDVIYMFCSVLSFILWSWAVFWIGYALLGFVHVLRHTKLRFKLTAWGLVFPNVSVLSLMYPLLFSKYLKGCFRQYHPTSSRCLWFRIFPSTGSYSFDSDSLVVVSHLLQFSSYNPFSHSNPTDRHRRKEWNRQWIPWTNSGLAPNIPTKSYLTS